MTTVVFLRNAHMKTHVPTCIYSASGTMDKVEIGENGNTIKYSCGGKGDVVMSIGDPFDGEDDMRLGGIVVETNEQTRIFFSNMQSYLEYIDRCEEEQLTCMSENKNKTC